MPWGTDKRMMELFDLAGRKVREQPQGMQRGSSKLQANAYQHAL